MNARLHTKLILALLLASPLAFANSPNTATGDDPAVLIEKSHQSFRVNEDGSYREEVETQLLLKEERAVRQKSQSYIYLNKQLDTLESIEAYTLKADGRKVMVTPEQIKTQADPASANAPMFQDVEYKVVIFPEVAVGDRLYLKQVRQRKPLFPGYFADVTTPAFNPYQQFTLSYDLPANMPLKSEQLAFTPSAVKTEGGRKRYEWRYDLTPKSRMERDAVAYVDFGQRLLVSTFKDYGELAKAYEQGAQDAAKPSAEVAALARQITQGVSDPRQQTLALANWVRKNLRYVAVYIGTGGVVPHKAGDILSNRYGDCKDHATLLQAMLSAVGIDSTTALIHSGNSYQLPAVPAVEAFNHAIVYVPQLDLYLDATAKGIQPGFLMPAELDKPVLHTRSGKLARTPSTQQGEVNGRFSIKLAADGSAEFEQHQLSKGWAAELGRYVNKNMTETMRNEFISRMLPKLQMKGSGKMALSGPQDQLDRQQISLTGHIDNFANLPGPVGISSMSSLIGGVSDGVQGLLAEASRSQPFVCGDAMLKEEASIELPANTKVLKLPNALQLDDRYFSYQASYKQDAGSIKLVRELTIKPLGRRVCTPEDFQQMKPTLEKIARDVRGQILVEGAL